MEIVVYTRAILLFRIGQRGGEADSPGVLTMKPNGRKQRIRLGRLSQYRRHPGILGERRERVGLSGRACTSLGACRCRFGCRRATARRTGSSGDLG